MQLVFSLLCLSLTVRDCGSLSLSIHLTVIFPYVFGLQQLVKNEIREKFVLP